MSFDFIVFLCLLACGYFFGSYRERTHYKSIFQREKSLANILTFSAKTPPEDILNNTVNSQLVDGSVVISVDYFKRFLAGLRGFFGGNMKSYETLIDRGRREAILRMKEQAEKIDTNMIFNVKLETASISKGEDKRVGSIEVYAYGTALKTRSIPTTDTPNALTSDTLDSHLA